MYNVDFYAKLILSKLYVGVRMRKTINIAVFVVFIWLLLDVVHLPDLLLGFLLVGEVPGTNLVLSPTIMLALLTALTLIVIFEVLAHHIMPVKRLRQNILNTVAHFERSPRRSVKHS